MFSIDIMNPQTLNQNAYFFLFLPLQCTESKGRSVDRARAWCFSMGTPFFRFNPPLATATGLDEARDPYLFRMLWETDVYIKENQDKIEQLANLLNSL